MRNVMNSVAVREVFAPGSYPTVTPQPIQVHDRGDFAQIGVLLHIASVTGDFTPPAAHLSPRISVVFVDQLSDDPENAFKVERELFVINAPTGSSLILKQSVRPIHKFVSLKLYFHDFNAAGYSNPAPVVNMSAVLLLGNGSKNPA